MKRKWNLALASRELIAAMSKSRIEGTWRGMRKGWARDIESAIGSMPDVIADPERTDGYILLDAGEEYRFFGKDAHRLAAWIVTRMQERQSALFLARESVTRIGSGHDAGVEGAESEARDPLRNPRYRKLRELINKAIDRGEDPRAHVAPYWREEFPDIPKSTMYELIKRVKESRQKK